MILISDMERVEEWSDTELIDFLSDLDIPEGYGWVLRRSTTGRGWRLYTSSQFELEGKLPHPDPRTAIKEYVKHELEILRQVDRETSL